MIGTSDSTASDTDVTAFVDWLNTKSSCLVTVSAREVETINNVLEPLTGVTHNDDQ